jgi:peptide/nickel transport system permease protein
MQAQFGARPAAASVTRAIPVDLSLAGLILLFAVVIGAGAGIAAALNNGGRIDRGVTLVCSVRPGSP